MGLTIVLSDYPDYYDWNTITSYDDFTKFCKKLIYNCISVSYDRGSDSQNDSDNRLLIDIFANIPDNIVDIHIYTTSIPTILDYLPAYTKRIILKLYNTDANLDNLPYRLLYFTLANTFNYSCVSGVVPIRVKYNISNLPNNIENLCLSDIDTWNIGNGRVLPPRLTDLEIVQTTKMAHKYETYYTISKISWLPDSIRKLVLIFSNNNHPYGGILLSALPPNIQSLSLTGSFAFGFRELPASLTEFTYTYDCANAQDIHQHISIINLLATIAPRNYNTYTIK